MPKKNLVRACALVGLMLGFGACTSSDGNQGGEGPGGQHTTGEASSFAQVNAVAKMIYDAAEAGEDLAPYIQGVFEGFGVPVLASPEDADRAGERLKVGFVTTQMITRMAEAYRDGVLIDAASYGRELRERKIQLYSEKLGGVEAPFDEFFMVFGMFLTTGISNYDKPNTPMNAKHVLQTLVWALGQERAERAVSEEERDPSCQRGDIMCWHPEDGGWGDGALDPLQFTLLNLTLFSGQTGMLGDYSPSYQSPTYQAPSFTDRAGPTSKGAIIKQVAGELKGEIASELGTFLEVPTDLPSAGFATVCASLILYGHQTTITNTPDLLWRAPLTPNVTDVEMTLTFVDDYENYHKTEQLRETIDRANDVLGMFGIPFYNCKIPKQGPQAGKTVRWEAAPQLEAHGSFDVLESTTGEAGEASNRWSTVEDDVVQACKILERQRDVVGWTQVTATGLVEGWSGLERAVTALKNNPSWGASDPLTVLYYKRVTIDDTCHHE